MDPLAMVSEASELAGLPSNTSTALGGTASGRASASNSGDFIVGGGTASAITNWVMLGLGALIAVVWLVRR